MGNLVIPISPFTFFILTIAIFDWPLPFLLLRALFVSLEVFFIKVAPRNDLLISKSKIQFQLGGLLAFQKF